MDLVGQDWIDPATVWTGLKQQSRSIGKRLLQNPAVAVRLSPSSNPLQGRGFPNMHWVCRCR